MQLRPLLPPITLLALSPCLAGQAAVDATFELPGSGLQVSLVGLAGFERRDVEHDQIQAAWDGKLGRSRVRITLWCYPRREFGFRDSDDVIDLIAFHYRERRQQPAFRYDRRFLREGPYGALAYCTIATATKKRGTKIEIESESFWLGGVLETLGYNVQVACEPAPDAAGRRAILGFFEKGIRARCKKDDIAWTEQEVEARWREFTPEKLHEKLRKPLRTKHYIILTNSSGGKLFGKKMEDCYKRIRAIYPFDEVVGRRLMPVFLFRDREEYFDFYCSIAKIPRAQAARSKGHAWRDYYATYYEAPNDPVHIHEATHQIFGNRLRLRGGGSWFQEGVAEYVERLYRGYNEMKSYAKRAAKRASHVPFRKFVLIPSLIAAGRTSRGESQAHNQYTQAASIIAFLRESKWGKKKFLDFVHAVGAVKRGDLAAIESAVQRVYGTDLAGLEERWLAYWRK